jgi:hypothetical protein
MPRVWFLLPVLLAAAPAPKPVYVRFSFKSSPPEIASRAVAALERGLFSDSLIVRAPDSLRLNWGTRIPTDSAGRSRIATTVLVRGRITPQGTDVDLCIVLLNTLSRPMSGPDSTRIPAQQLDSALTAIGRRYAEILAGQRRPAASATSCSY